VNKTGEYLILATASLLAKGKLAVMGVGGGGVDYGSDPNFRRKHSAETLSPGSGPWQQAGRICNTKPVFKYPYQCSRAIAIAHRQTEDQRCKKKTSNEKEFKYSILIVFCRKISTLC